MLNKEKKAEKDKRKGKKGRERDNHWLYGDVFAF